MTREELQELYYIKKEIQLWQEELIKLRIGGTVRSPIFTALPKGSKKYTMEDYVVEITEYEEKLGKLLNRAQIKQKQLLEFIECLDDSLIKQIIYLRNLSLLDWEDVAMKIGGGNTSDGIKKKYYRFLKKNEDKIKYPA